jgi:hypothetical protein
MLRLCKLSSFLDELLLMRNRFADADNASVHHVENASPTNSSCLSCGGPATAADQTVTLAARHFEMIKEKSQP